MKKIITLVCLLFLGCSNIYAQETTEDLLKMFQDVRSEIYSSLELNNDQIMKINNIDTQVYVKLAPELQEISKQVQTLLDLTNNGNYTESNIKAIQKDFNTIEKRIDVIKNQYEKEFNDILDNNQKTLYKNTKKEIQTKYSKAIEAEIEAMRSQFQSDL